jgi:hypothetical protein
VAGAAGAPPPAPGVELHVVPVREVRGRAGEGGEEDDGVEGCGEASGVPGAGVCAAGVKLVVEGGGAVLRRLGCCGDVGAW